MAHAYLDCFSGISGDMVLGALVDLGLPLDVLKDGLRRLAVDDRIALRCEPVRRGGLAATLVRVETAEEHHHRHLADIERIIAASDFPPAVKERAREVFVRLAEAEAAVHGTTPDRIHFHEVGALDAIADVCGAALGMHELGIDRVAASAVTVGFGEVVCAHGRMPVPAPATAELLRGVPIRAGAIESEMATPTGAAILRTYCDRFGPLGDFRIDRIGCGAGTRSFPHHANMLRVLLGEENPSRSPSSSLECESSLSPSSAELAPPPAAAAAHTPNSLRASLAHLPLLVDTLTLLQTDIDDMAPSLFPALADCLYDAGAREVHLVPVIMKHGRPGATIEVLADPEREAALCEILLRESTTLGVRLQRVERASQRREMREVAIEGVGAVRVKIAYWGERAIRAMPELRDCEQLARTTSRPLADILRLASAAALRLVDAK